MMVSPTFAPHRTFFVLRKDGARELGAEWPEGATCRLRDDQHVIQFDGAGAHVIKTRHQADVLRRALDSVTRGTTKQARIGTAVGTFGSDTLYEESARFTDPSFVGTSRSLPANAKTVHLKIGRVTGEEIEGFASTPEPDREFDVILPEAFSKSLPKFLQNPCLLFNHDFDRPIGSVLAVEVRPEGLWVRCKVDDPDVRQYVAEKRVRAFSVSFIVMARRFDKNPAATEPDPSGQRRQQPPELRVITEAELLEVSIVTIPMGRNALFSVSKGIDAGTDLVCRSCGIGGVACECDGGSRVVALRSFPVSAKSVAFRFDPREIMRSFGSRGLRQSAAWTDTDDPFDATRCLFVHHHVDDGELRLSSEGLHLAMARLVAGGDDLSPADRKGAHSHLAAHYVEIGDDPPAYDQAPDPSAWWVTAFAGGTAPASLRFDKSVAATDTLARKWLASHGAPSPGGASVDGGGSVVIEYNTTGTHDRFVEVVDGVTAEFRTATESVMRKAFDPAAIIAGTVPPTPTPAPAAVQPTTPAPAAADTAVVAADELIEVDVALLAHMESAIAADAPNVDPDVAEAVLDQVAVTIEALKPTE